jgi:hypothetical protein
MENAVLEKDSFLVKREKVVPSRTRIFEMGCGEKSITISYDENNRPIEVFIYAPKEQSCNNCVAAFTGKMCSGILREKSDEETRRKRFEFLIKNLLEMQCEGAAWDDAIYVRSCFHAVAICLQEPFVPDEDTLSFCAFINSGKVVYSDD